MHNRLWCGGFNHSPNAIWNSRFYSGKTKSNHKEKKKSNIIKNKQRCVFYFADHFLSFIFKYSAIKMSRVEIICLNLLFFSRFATCFLNVSFFWKSLRANLDQATQFPPGVARFNLKFFFRNVYVCEFIQSIARKMLYLRRNNLIRLFWFVFGIRWWIIIARKESQLKRPCIFRMHQI